MSISKRTLMMVVAILAEHERFSILVPLVIVKVLMLHLLQRYVLFLFFPNLNIFAFSITLNKHVSDIFDRKSLFVKRRIYKQNF